MSWSVFGELLCMKWLGWLMVDDGLRTGVSGCYCAFFWRVEGRFIKKRHGNMRARVTDVFLLIPPFVAACSFISFFILLPPFLSWLQAMLFLLLR